MNAQYSSQVAKLVRQTSVFFSRVQNPLAVAFVEGRHRLLGHPYLEVKRTVLVRLPFQHLAMGIEPGQVGAVGRVQDQFMHRSVAQKSRLDDGKQFGQPFAGRGGDDMPLLAARRVRGSLIEKNVTSRFVDKIDLVPDLYDASAIRGVEPELLQNLGHVAGLSLGILVGDIADMQDDRRLDHFLKRCPEGGDQMRRQIGNEADGVRQDGIGTVRQLDAP